jgi:chitin disaccharide deacetylase
MLIITADDYGITPTATDAILRCGLAARITSASAMVFMADSERSAALAGGSPLEFGLHLNFTELPTGANVPDVVRRHIERTARFLTRHRLAHACYHPGLRDSFRIAFDAQCEEYERSYRVPAPFFNGHHHMHLCANVVLAELIPRASRVRTSFTFEAGQKSRLNLAYRRMIHRRVLARYVSTDSFFSIEPLHDAARHRALIERSRSEAVEIETHPATAKESQFLLGGEFGALLARTLLGRFGDLSGVRG